MHIALSSGVIKTGMPTSMFVFTPPAPLKKHLYARYSSILHHCTMYGRMGWNLAIRKGLVLLTTWKESSACKCRETATAIVERYHGSTRRNVLHKKSHCIVDPKISRGTQCIGESPNDRHCGNHALEENPIL